MTYKKIIQAHGIGYKGKLFKGNILELRLGFSHTIYLTIPHLITIILPKPNRIILESTDHNLVSSWANRIKQLRPVEPYKGKGLRYLNDHITLKERKNTK